MARSEVVLRQARRAYERAFIVAALRGIGLAVVLTLAAIALHRTTEVTLLVAAGLAATLATVRWRGGAWARGAVAGVLAGIPVFISPVLYRVFAQGNVHCTQCITSPSLNCVLICLGASAAVGAAVGYAALRDRAPRAYATSAIVTALLTGLLGCGSLGLAGAFGVALGLLAGSATGWVAANRAVRA